HSSWTRPRRSPDPLAGSTYVLVTVTGISGIHARLVVTETHCTVEDLKSRNGTALNNTRLEENVTTALPSRGTLSLAEYLLTYTIPGHPDYVEAAQRERDRVRGPSLRIEVRAPGGSRDQGSTYIDADLAMCVGCLAHAVSAETGCPEDRMRLVFMGSVLDLTSGQTLSELGVTPSNNVIYMIRSLPSRTTSREAPALLGTDAEPSMLESLRMPVPIFPPLSSRPLTRSSARFSSDRERERERDGPTSSRQIPSLSGRERNGDTLMVSSSTDGERDEMRQRDRETREAMLRVIAQTEDLLAAGDPDLEPEERTRLEGVLGQIRQRLAESDARRSRLSELEGGLDRIRTGLNGLLRAGMRERDREREGEGEGEGEMEREVETERDLRRLIVSQLRSQERERRAEGEGGSGASRGSRRVPVIRRIRISRDMLPQLLGGMPGASGAMRPRETGTGRERESLSTDVAIRALLRDSLVEGGMSETEAREMVRGMVGAPAAASSTATDAPSATSTGTATATDAPSAASTTTGTGTTSTTETVADQSAEYQV
ncbi:hypothetical protein KIPB_006315, partial [Kipferlia bialata]